MKNKTYYDFSRYEERSAVLLSIGFKSYRDYLASELWKSIRARVLELHDGECYPCGDVATQIHHRFYTRAVLLGEDLDVRLIVPICDPCHKHIETDKTGGKAPLHMANKRLLSLCRRYGRQ